METGIGITVPKKDILEVFMRPNSNVFCEQKGISMSLTQPLYSQKDGIAVTAWSRSMLSTRAKYARLCALFATALLLSLLSSMFASPRAEAAPLYSCGNGSSGHCYAVQNWDGGTPGARTSIFTNGIFSGDCFVTNEMWLAQSNPYWVEAGMLSDIADQFGSETLFWADSRPNGGGFNLHYGQFLDPSDFGKYANLDIHKIASDQFSVRISGLPVASLSGTSKYNAINPNRIGIGLEMCGSSNARAPRNGYTKNQWQRGDGTWAYQTALGYLGPQAYPAHGYWTTTPNPSNGGQWTTCILGNGC